MPADKPVEVVQAELPCGYCSGSGRVEHHVAETKHGDRYVSITCDQCEGTGIIGLAHAPPPADDASVEDLISDLADVPMAGEDPSVHDGPVDGLIAHARAVVAGKPWPPSCEDIAPPPAAPSDVARELRQLINELIELHKRMSYRIEVEPRPEFGVADAGTVIGAAVELEHALSAPREGTVREQVAREIEGWKPDASFDDSMLGSVQVRAIIQNCADIARRGTEFPGVAALTTKEPRS